MANPGKGTVHQNRLKELSKNLPKDRDSFIRFCDVPLGITKEETEKILDTNTSGGNTDFEKSYYDALMTRNKREHGAYEKLQAELLGADSTSSSSADYFVDKETPVSDVNLKSLSKKLADELSAKYFDFAKNLDISEEDAQNILDKCSGDCQQSFLEILHAWKIKTNGSYTLLKNALTSTDAEVAPRLIPGITQLKTESAGAPGLPDPNLPWPYNIDPKHREDAGFTSVPAVASSQNPEGSGGQDEDYEVEPDEGRYTQEMKPANPTDDELNDEKRYQMNAHPKGLLFLLNIKKSRKGSDVDFDNIKHVFKEIGYVIEPHIDLNAEDLKAKLQTFVDQERHKEMCSVVFVLMGHGNKREITCSDDKGVSRKFIEEKVFKMDSMLGKPKMIFYHTCLKDAEQEETDDDSGAHLDAKAESDVQTAEDAEQEETDDDSAHLDVKAESDVQTADSEEEEETDEASGTCLDVESESDVLIVNATIEGRGAKRHRKTGTWFIGILCKVLLERAHKDDLEKMLKQVSGMLREKRDKKGKSQTSGFNNQGFPKYLYFLPKYPPQNVSP